MNKDIIDFWNLYWSVFNKDGSVKLCGRDKCKDLILCCNNMIENYSDFKYDFGLIDISEDYFGNLKSGMMNIEKIQQLKSWLDKWVKQN